MKSTTTTIPGGKPDRRRRSPAEPVQRSHASQQQSLDALLRTIHDLDNLNDLSSVMACVRGAVREIVKADGAALVLREGEEVYYADEDANGPLWKGQHFPIAQCISGLSIRDDEQIAIKDIYRDPRIPHEAYRKTFVKSLVVIPIGRRNRVGALGAYWAQTHRASKRELALLRAVADCISLAIQNIKLNQDLAKLRHTKAHVAFSSLILQEMVRSPRPAFRGRDGKSPEVVPG